MTFTHQVLDKPNQTKPKLKHIKFLFEKSKQSEKRGVHRVRKRETREQKRVNGNKKQKTEKKTKYYSNRECGG